MSAIVVDRVLTADNTDVLAGTDLDSLPARGQLDVFAASTQQDTLITVSGPGIQAPVRAQAVVMRANAEIRQLEDPSYRVRAAQAKGHYVVNVDMVTAATIRVRIIWQPR